MEKNKGSMDAEAARQLAEARLAIDEIVPGQLFLLDADVIGFLWQPLGTFVVFSRETDHDGIELASTGDIAAVAAVATGDHGGGDRAARGRGVGVNAAVDPALEMSVGLGALRLRGRAGCGAAMGNKLFVNFFKHVPDVRASRTRRARPRARGTRPS